MKFHRAKKALQKQLTRRGFGRGSLLMALTLFGKMTAPSEAAATGLSVSAATIRVGLVAGTAGLIATKSAVVTIVATGIVSTGAIVTISDRTAPFFSAQTNNSQAVLPGPDITDDECWYYYPREADGPVMLRMMKADSHGVP